MKRILLLLAIFFVFFSGTPTGKIVEFTNSVYYVKYSEVFEQPLQVKYAVQCTETKFSRAGLDFIVPKDIHTSDNADYANNDYDKGHMAPAADFACDKNSLALTFSYLNCALQHKNLNRGAWRFLESYERELAKTSKVNVTIDLKFSNASVKLATGATVPDGFTKTIEYSGKKEVYYFPNVAPTKSSYKDYKVTDK
jgi:endonuclease G